MFLASTEVGHWRRRRRSPGERGSELGSRPMGQERAREERAPRSPRAERYRLRDSCQGERNTDRLSVPMGHFAYLYSMQCLAVGRVVEAAIAHERISGVFLARCRCSVSFTPPEALAVIWNDTHFMIL